MMSALLLRNLVVSRTKPLFHLKFISTISCVLFAAFFVQQKK